MPKFNHDNCNSIMTVTFDQGQWWIKYSNVQPRFGKQVAASQASSARRLPLTHLLTPVLPKLDSTHHLLVDEVGGHVVFRGVVPGCKDLFVEEKPPRGIAFLSTLLLGILLTLGDGIHDMVTATAQGRDLQAEPVVTAEKPQWEGEQV